MARAETLLVVVVAVAVSATVGVEAATSLDHIVGGRLGWTIPPNATYYQDWTAGKTFVVGDKLVFMYRSGMQNVMQVPKEDFDACTENKIIDWQYTGPTVIELKNPGPHYYYCAIGTHCESGQKLFVDVSATPVADPARDGLAPPPAAAGAAAKSSSGTIRCAGVIAGLIASLVLGLFM